MESLKIIHSKLKIIHGFLSEELIEQSLSCKYLNKNDTVLEIGGNMGRNALVISYILENDTQFVTMEPNNEFYYKLIENKNINNKNFYVENSALSLTPLCYHNSLTFNNISIVDKFPTSSLKIKMINNNCNIISFEKLEEKYNLKFNVLIIDCEGSFYYILKEMEYIINNINLIIMENDYENIEHYRYIKNLLINKNFICIESIPLIPCPWNAPCKENFYEVWKINTR